MCDRIDKIFISATTDGISYGHCEQMVVLQNHLYMTIAFYGEKLVELDASLDLNSELLKGPVTLSGLSIRNISRKLKE